MHIPDGQYIIHRIYRYLEYWYPWICIIIHPQIINNRGRPNRRREVGIDDFSDWALDWVSAICRNQKSGQEDSVNTSQGCVMILETKYCWCFCSWEDETRCTMIYQLCYQKFVGLSQFFAQYTDGIFGMPISTSRKPLCNQGSACIKKLDFTRRLHSSTKDHDKMKTLRLKTYKGWILAQWNSYALGYVLSYNLQIDNILPHRVTTWRYCAPLYSKVLSYLFICQFWY